jgi:hypothetical protein
MAGVLLLVAGVAKLVDGGGMRPLLRGVGVPESLVRAARFGVPVVEVVTGVWLLTASLPVAAGAVASLVAASFVVTLLLASARGVAEPCRCFGALDRARSPRVSLARALVLLVAALVVPVAASRAGAASAALAPEWWLGVLLALSAVLGFALIGEVAAFRDGVRRRLAAETGIDNRGQAQ